jgi:multidrug efflux pump subunit AcrA (membrane-fusion protein)
MKKTVLVSAVFLAGAILCLSGCDRLKDTYSQLQNRSGPALQVQNVPVFAVNTIPASRGQIMDYLALSGDIIASSLVDTYSDAAGRISRLYVSVGSRVSRGDPVAAVDPSRPGMDFVASIVRAPVAGTIVSLPAQLGMTISQAVPLARISGGAGLEIRLYVAERFISKISLNQSCEISLDAYPGEVFRGSVHEISPTVDATSRTMEIRVTVQDTKALLKAGMFAKVRIITEQKNDIVKIPVSAVVNRFGEQYVFVVEGGSNNPTARRRPIVQGILIDGVLEVSQGLSPGDEVIVRGQSLLEDGSRINIIDRLAPLSAANSVGGN